MNKQQLASKIWNSVNKMRSKIEANEYKDYILGFIFYKFLSDNQVRELIKYGYTYEGICALTEDDPNGGPDLSRDAVGYFIAGHDLFSSWIKAGADFTVDDVSTALSAFERNIAPDAKKVFGDIFHTLSTGLSKLGENPGSRTKAIRELIYIIKDLPTDGKADYDVLGFIYEYLISNFAANAGKKAGEFYTPHEVSILMSQIVAQHMVGRDSLSIYDPTSGSGSLLINIGKEVGRYTSIDPEKGISYFAQELKESTFNLTRMNLIMHNIDHRLIEVKNADTLEDDWPVDIHSGDQLRIDAVVSNPPYSQVWEPDGKELDARFSEFGLAPRSKADYAFLLHDLFHLKPDGIMTIVLPHGVLFRGGEEGTIRQRLLEKGHIDAIIGLPANIFFGTGIPTIIMVIKQTREKNDVLFIDASKGFVKEGKSNRLRARDIKKIVDTYKDRKSIPGFSRAVSLDEIRKNDYNLNIPRYIDSSERSNVKDLYATMFGGIPTTEIAELQEYWTAFPGLQEALFQDVEGPYKEFRTQDIPTAVRTHPAVTGFMDGYRTAVAGLPAFLESRLLTDVKHVEQAHEEERIDHEIWQCLKDVPLIDRYDAYQILDDRWNAIAGDLELLHDEDLAALKKVDPNIVIKKKSGKDQEVQEGWMGHILPFDLVQKVMMSDELNRLQKIRDRVSRIQSELEELADQIPEDDKSAEFMSESQDAFVPAVVKKTIKENAASDETMKILKEADRLFTEDKTTKRELKRDELLLQEKTKAIIENLTDDEAISLLKEKWISPFMTDLEKLPENAVSAFIKKLQDLESKYDHTLIELEKEIQETETKLAEMLGELTGNEWDMKGIAGFARLLSGGAD